MDLDNIINAKNMVDYNNSLNKYEEMMKKDYSLESKDFELLIDNAFTLYDVGIKYHNIPEGKHGRFLLLTMHNYYKQLIDYLQNYPRKDNVEYKFSANKIDNNLALAYTKVLYESGTNNK